MRIAPVDSSTCWMNIVENPFYEHNIEGFRVVRKLFSRFVARHEKSQTSADGKFLLSLPPRSVETVFLRFGSKEEELFYNCINARNRAFTQDSQHESRAKGGFQIHPTERVAVCCQTGLCASSSG